MEDEILKRISEDTPFFGAVFEAEEELACIADFDSLTFFMCPFWAFTKSATKTFSATHLLSAL